MPPSVWTTAHADYLMKLVVEEEMNAVGLSARMSKHFGVRITPSQVNHLLTRMRTPTDPLFRRAPYRRTGSKYSAY